MSQINAFAPLGNSIIVLPTNSTANVSLNGIVGPTFGLQVRFRNATTLECFLNWGPTNAVTAVVPTIGTPATGMPFPPGVIEVVTLPPGTLFIAYIQAVAGGTGNFYFTQGEGV